MFCENCGKKRIGEKAFCPHCGNRYKTEGGEERHPSPKESVLSSNDSKLRPFVKYAWLLIGGSIVCGILYIVQDTSMGDGSSSEVPAVRSNVEQTMERTAQDTNNAKSNRQLSQEEAEKIIDTWLAQHPFKQEVEITGVKGKPYRVPGGTSEYYGTNLHGMTRIYTILIDAYTGKLYLFDTGKPEDLDMAYEKRWKSRR